EPARRKNDESRKNKEHKVRGQRGQDSLQEKAQESEHRIEARCQSQTAQPGIWREWAGACNSGRLSLMGRQSRTLVGKTHRAQQSPTDLCRAHFAKSSGGHWHTAGEKFKRLG